MSEKTIADIIAEMRHSPIPKHRTDHELLSLYADRLEAAPKRKLSDFNPKRDWSVQEALGFANTLANHGWTREANSDAASSCIYSLCRLLKGRGDCAKLREACEAALDMIFDLQNCNRSPIANSVYAVRRKIKDALAATEKEGGAI